MTKPLPPLSPHEIIRLKDAGRYFGFRPTQLAEKIRTGEIPAPLPLSESGRACGWTGEMILEHHRRLAEKREAPPKKATSRRSKRVGEMSRE